jgi:predicted  nucleic acid-binding Zn-ribbon protein
MAEVSNEFIVEILRRLQSDVADIKVDVRETRSRIGLMERQIADVHVRLADLSSRMDRRDEMMERVMRRLELGESSH